MVHITEPKNFEEENWMYLSVGYHNGKVIAKNESGELFYIECEEEIAPIGTVISEGVVTPLEELEEGEQEEIIKIYADVVGE